MKRGMVVVGALLAVLLTAVAGCTRANPDAATTTIVHTEITTVPAPTPSPVAATPTPTPTYTPAPATTVVGLPPSASPPAGERQADCPYISTADAETTEGNRIYRTAVITDMHPEGCRFYFWCCDFHATMDIVTHTFATPLDAYNAMVRTGEAGKNVIGVKALVPGVSAVLYQTKFYGPDDGTDWACTFAKGKVMVTVHTNQDNVSFNAKQLAMKIAPKF